MGQRPQPKPLSCNTQSTCCSSLWHLSDAFSLLFSSLAILDPNWMALFGSWDDIPSPSKPMSSNPQSTCCSSLLHLSEAFSLLFSSLAILDPNWMALFGSLEDAPRPRRWAATRRRSFSPTPLGRFRSACDGKMNNMTLDKCIILSCLQESCVYCIKAPLHYL